jgi:Sulfotransferase family
VSAENRSEIGDYLERPIILIGAGRSGSTLFARMLNAHPQVQFLLETDFLIARIWREVWDNRLFWVHSLNSQYHVMREPTSAREPPAEVPAEVIAAAKERASRGVRRLFAELMQVKPGYAAWGFKEIWNGNPAVAQIPWSIYRRIFPHARWVHLVRDPFTFVHSSARWNQLPLTIYLLKKELQHWQQVVEWSQELAGVPDFFEIRYEDLVSSPKTTLAPILGSVRLCWRDECECELNRLVLASEQLFSLGVKKIVDHGHINQIIDKITGLRRSMQTFGYEAPTELAIAIEKKTRLPPMKKDYAFIKDTSMILGNNLRQIRKILSG